MIAAIVNRRTCRVCGCHDRDACWGDTTGACWWVEDDLCSACNGDQPDAHRDDRVDLIAAGYPGDEALFGTPQNDCAGHVASTSDPKVCGRCSVHIDDLRPDDDGFNIFGSGPVPIGPREG